MNPASVFWATLQMRMLASPAAEAMRSPPGDQARRVTPLPCPSKRRIGAKPAPLAALAASAPGHRQTVHWLQAKASCSATGLQTSVVIGAPASDALAIGC